MKKTIKEFAEELQGYFTTDTRVSGESFIKNTDDCPKWVKEFVQKAPNDFMLDDYKYQFVSDAIDYISDYGDNDDLLGCPEIEPNYHTSDLTAWLHSDNRRTHYLTEVLEKMNLKDDLQALAMAQLREKEEVYFIILNGIKERLTEENEEEEE